MNRWQGPVRLKKDRELRAAQKGSIALTKRERQQLGHATEKSPIRRHRAERLRADCAGRGHAQANLSDRSWDPPCAV